ncbi:hypothetical protein NX786_07975 [Telluria mixta]|uniref:Spore protein YkvP/CgeB glycosyl transferase-like domain-containing protein n=1 Tax=Telluria mixta TaxID=34071 RepID=A0ABT2BWE9_9BURK|nr:hypothetical protein [Telluria mixta]MCS0629267.1 hypothetical protein [Telluria mixta]WEM97703.1 hypothetical protein P0M04_08285 [Telluria mixta]
MNHTGMNVTFYLPDHQQVDQIEAADPDRDWRLFSTGVQVWVGQTYLRLKHQGFAVGLSATVPSAGIVVMHADHVPRLLAERSLWSNLTIVSARADRPPQPHADIEIVQNRTSAEGVRVLHIQHWPQPGLVRRDPARGTKVENVAFKGAAGEMAPAFASDLWGSRMAELGVQWHCDAAQWVGNAAQYATNWHDYRSTDVILAVRKDLQGRYPRKPASKLINAWLAGVPAILGPESAYGELRRSELDYIEVTSAEEAYRAIEKLKNDPDLYMAMVQNGQKRAEEVSARTCTNAWADLLFRQLQDRVPTSMVALFPKTMRCRVSRMIRRQP